MIRNDLFNRNHHHTTHAAGSFLPRKEKKSEEKVSEEWEERERRGGRKKMNNLLEKTRRIVITSRWSWLAWYLQIFRRSIRNVASLVHHWTVYGSVKNVEKKGLCGVGGLFGGEKNRGASLLLISLQFSNVIPMTEIDSIIQTADHTRLGASSTPTVQYYCWRNTWNENTKITRKGIGKLSKSNSFRKVKRSTRINVKNVSL